MRPLPYAIHVRKPHKIYRVPTCPRAPRTFASGCTPTESIARSRYNVRVTESCKSLPEISAAEFPIGHGISSGGSGSGMPVNRVHLAAKTNPAVGAGARRLPRQTARLAFALHHQHSPFVLRPE